MAGKKREGKGKNAQDKQALDNTCKPVMINEKEEQNEKQDKRTKEKNFKKSKHKKTKRRTTAEKKMKEISIYYINIRGLKSKIESLKEAIEKTRPDIIAIVETHLGEDEKIRIKGYDTESFRQDRNSEGGGVMIAVKDGLKNVAIQVSQNKEPEESLWIVVGTRKQYKLGLIYVPKGDSTIKSELEKIYERIREEVEMGEAKSQRVVVMGDLNCKVGGLIVGNKEEESKGGKMLIQMLKDSNMKLLNSLQICKGKWTRIEKDKKSILDYVLMKEKEIDQVTKMIVDESKELTPYRVVKENGVMKTIYSDHVSIRCNIKWIEKAEEKQLNIRKIMTKKSYERYRNMLEQQKVYI